jgi:hypothetical protein
MKINLLRLFLELEPGFKTNFSGDRFHGFMPLVGENDPDSSFSVFFSRFRHRNDDRRISSEKSSGIHHVFFLRQSHDSGESGRGTLSDVSDLCLSQNMQSGSQ